MFKSKHLGKNDILFLIIQLQYAYYKTFKGNCLVIYTLQMKIFHS